MASQLRTKLLSSVENYLEQIQQQISQKILQLKESSEKLTKGLSTWYRGDESAEAVKLAVIHDKQEILEMEKMKASPYFSSLKVQFESDQEPKENYISKYSFIEHNIYSWISPIARMRFFEPGNDKAGFMTPLGKERRGKIFDKKKYLIRESELYNLEYQEAGGQNEVVFHKDYEGLKTFGLTEVIEKLDAFQDEIIRLDPRGSLLVAGMAGSGKTTLALHKMAFLTQDLGWRKFYRPAKSLIFVQDEATKAYFGAILPALSLAGTKITTFNEWAVNMLGLKGYKIMHDPRVTDYELLLEAKFQALRHYHEIDFKADDPYFILKAYYMGHFDENTYAAFVEQKNAKILDRFDLTILLKNYLEEHEPLDYDLIIVDEAENYLAAQLQIIKKFRSRTTGSIIYIGDLVQQTYLFTIQSWEEVGENFVNNRQIKLPTVYRFSSTIADYLYNKGYSQAKMATSIKDGIDVKEVDLSDRDKDDDSLLNRIRQQIQQANSMDIVGIIFNDKKVGGMIQANIPANEKVHILSIQEAQGVEFDSVILVFNKIDNKFAQLDISPELKDQMAKVMKDQFFVGATRSKRLLSVIWV